MCSKAFNILNIIFRCFISNDLCYLTKASITYVRPLLEYNIVFGTLLIYICRPRPKTYN